MKNIIIVGTGAIASELTMYIKDIKDIQLKGYLEYDYNVNKYYNSYHYEMPVLGDVDTYIPIANDFFLIGVSDVRLGW